MLFSYAVRSVYIESCSLFVRGGVYRVVKEAMGGFLAKLSVSALMFDYILTGPISGVSAGQYIMGLVRSLLHNTSWKISVEAFEPYKTWGSVIIAVLITLYFFRENIRGIHESSGKALKIMIATTIMGLVMLGWCGITLIVRSTPEKEPAKVASVDNLEREPISVHQEPNTLHYFPDLRPKPDPSDPNSKPESPLGFIKDTKAGKELANLAQAPAKDWLSLVGALGVLIAFGHSILAMSGEETLAQVYREVESPKLKNFKKAAFIVFMYSLVLTVGISFLAVILIPDNERMALYGDNLIGGLAMNVAGPVWARIMLNAFVVFIGFLILAGAVNTAIIGSNGVLNRVAEDGVLPDWFLKPHSKYGTTYRVLVLIIGLQLFTIIASRGDVLVLGEAYAFGVVWSFVFKSLAMVVLRFRDRSPREFMVPFNIKIGTVEIPIGLSLIFVVLFAAAITNLLTKSVATISGLIFTGVLLVVFMATEHYHESRRKGAKHAHREQFNRQTESQLSLAGLGLDRYKYRKLVAIRSPNNLFMLEKALAESDPATTFVIVMTAKLDQSGLLERPDQDLDTYDQDLMTAVVTRAEKSGKEVTPLIVPTNNPLFAVIKAADDLEAQELIVGMSNKHTADEQLDQLAFYWFNLCEGAPRPLTIRILSQDREVHLDLGGGNRVPRISERQAKSVAELRAAGVGVRRMLLAHDGSLSSHDLFENILTLIDPKVVLQVVLVPGNSLETTEARRNVELDQQWAGRLGRIVHLSELPGEPGPELVRMAREEHFDLIALAFPEPWSESTRDRQQIPWLGHVLEHASCPVFVAVPPGIPTEVDA